MLPVEFCLSFYYWDLIRLVSEGSERSKRVKSDLEVAASVAFTFSILKALIWAKTMTMVMLVFLVVVLCDHKTNYLGRIR